MRIFLLRHAKAEPGYPDASRRLAAKGRRHAEALGCFWSGASPLPDSVRLWTSPLTRARETADLLVETAAIKMVEAEQHTALEPESDPVGLVGSIREPMADLLVVGHNPNIATLASLLVSGERGRCRLRFKTCQLVCLEWLPLPNHGNQGPAELSWSLDPRLLGA